METELINNTGGIISSVQNEWQFAALLVIIIFVAFLILRNDLKLKKTNDDTEIRVKSRNEQMLKFENRMDKIEQTVGGIGRSLDRHKNEEHEFRDGKFAKDFASLDGRLTKELTSVDNRLKIIEQNLIKKEEFNELQKNVYAISKGVAVIETIISERSENKRL